MNRQSKVVASTASMAVPARCDLAAVEASGQPFDLGVGAYRASEADFPNGCFVRTVNGRRYATGENKLGITVTLVLGLPLCGGCDQPLDCGVCLDCMAVYPRMAL